MEIAWRNPPSGLKYATAVFKFRSAIRRDDLWRGGFAFPKKPISKNEGT